MTERIFNKVNSDFCNSTIMQKLSIMERPLYTYLHISSHVTSCGIIQVTTEYLAVDMRFTPAMTKGLLARLALCDALVLDQKTGSIFLCDWFQHNPPQNRKHLKHIDTEISKCSSATVKKAAEEVLEPIRISKERDWDEAERKREEVKAASGLVARGQAISGGTQNLVPLAKLLGS